MFLLGTLFRSKSIQVIFGVVVPTLAFVLSEIWSGSMNPWAFRLLLGFIPIQNAIDIVCYRSDAGPHPARRIRMRAAIASISFILFIVTAFQGVAFLMIGDETGLGLAVSFWVFLLPVAAFLTSCYLVPAKSIDDMPQIIRGACFGIGAYLLSCCQLTAVYVALQWSAAPGPADAFIRLVGSVPILARAGCTNNNSIAEYPSFLLNVPPSQARARKTFERIYGRTYESAARDLDYCHDSDRQIHPPKN